MLDTPPIKPQGFSVLDASAIEDGGKLSIVRDTAPDLKARREILAHLENRCGQDQARTSKRRLQNGLLAAAALCAAFGAWRTLPDGGGGAMLAALALGGVLAIGAERLGCLGRAASGWPPPTWRTAWKDLVIAVAQVGGVAALASALEASPPAWLALGLGALLGFCCGWMRGGHDPHVESLRLEAERTRAELSHAETSFKALLASAKRAFDDEVKSLQYAAGMQPEKENPKKLAAAEIAAE